MRNPSRAVFQFYPSSDDQIQLITSIAQKAGFGGGIIVDYPNSKKAKKIFLCLMVGAGGGLQQMPKGLEGTEEENEEQVKFERRRSRERARLKNVKRKNVKDKEWILKKKEVSCFGLVGNDRLTHHFTSSPQLYRQRGKTGVPRDSKFTGRKRKTAF
jgi:18S rRNA (guanine1575-N7)-methyltransferase